MKTPIIDLHCHSTISDGLFSPEDLVKYAHSKNVDILALTDHDDIDGLDRACLLYTSPSPRDATLSRMPSSA